MEIVKITDFLKEELISLDLKTKSKTEVLKELSTILEVSKNITSKDECYQALVKREELGSTGIGKGVAIPHAKTDCSTELTLGFGISRNGINFDSLDGEDTKLFFVFASPVKDSHKYLKILARISRLIRNEEFRKALLGASSPKEIIEIIGKEEE